MLTMGVDVMIEANLNRVLAMHDLTRLGAIAAVMPVQCEAAPATVMQRYRDRALAGERHGAHFDMDALPDLRATLADNAYDLTPLGYPMLVVQTTDGYQPGSGHQPGAPS